MLDIFKSDAFSVASLTDAVNKVKFVPGRIGELGLFAETGVSTTTVAVEEKGGILSLVSPSQRGAPGATVDKAKRSMRPFSVPHFELNDAIYAEEIQNVRAFGQQETADTIMDKTMERLSILSQSMESTLEYQRIGAIKGVVTYADSSSLDLFSEFGVSQESEQDFDLDNASPASGALAKACRGVIRKIATNLDGVPWTGVHAFCGDAFFDDLLAHKEFREWQLNYPQAAQLAAANVTSGMSYGVVSFGGITWENYRGSVGGNDYVHTDKCHVFPLGVPSLFRTYYAPADWTETVNTQGQRLYTKQWEMPNGKGVNLDVQMNALSICTRPKALIKGKRT